MKLKTWIAIGTFAFTAWRSYRNMRSTVRREARSRLKRAYKAI